MSIKEEPLLEVLATIGVSLLLGQQAEGFPKKALSLHPQKVRISVLRRCRPPRATGLQL